MHDYCVDPDDATGYIQCRCHRFRRYLVKGWLAKHKSDFCLVSTLHYCGEVGLRRSLLIYLLLIGRGLVIGLPRRR